MGHQRTFSLGTDRNNLEVVNQAFMRVKAQNRVVIDPAGASPTVKREIAIVKQQIETLFPNDFADRLIVLPE
jgi:hypothetical protein